MTCDRDRAKWPDEIQLLGDKDRSYFPYLQRITLFPGFEQLMAEFPLAALDGGKDRSIQRSES